jgi:putative protease
MKSKTKKPAKKSSKKIAKKIIKKKTSLKETIKKKLASEKKIVLKKKKPEKQKKEKRIGKLVHYFDKIKVVVVKVSDILSIGDMIRIKGGRKTDFKQKIVSMEINGQKIKKAKKGQEIGIKVKEKAREGYLVFKIS